MATHKAYSGWEALDKILRSSESQEARAKAKALQQSYSTYNELLEQKKNIVLRSFWGKKYNLKPSNNLTHLIDPTTGKKYHPTARTFYGTPAEFFDKEAYEAKEAAKKAAREEEKRAEKAARKAAREAYEKEQAEIKRRTSAQYKDGDNAYKRVMNQGQPELENLLKTEGGMTKKYKQQRNDLYRRAREARELAYRDFFRKIQTGEFRGGGSKKIIKRKTKKNKKHLRKLKTHRKNKNI